MPKVDPETGEPMSDDPSGPEELRGGKGAEPLGEDNQESKEAEDTGQ